MNTTQRVRFYQRACHVVWDAGHGHEATWAASVRFATATPQTFLREHAWVALNAGMREAVVRPRFEKLRVVFDDWTSAAWIAENEASLQVLARRHFNHERKIAALLAAPRRVLDEGWNVVRASIAATGVEYLQTWPHIGPVTRYHLARNLGLDVVKPDRHLVRLAEALGCASPEALCQEIAAVTGDRVGVVDIVLWRWCSLQPAGYAERLREQFGG